MRKTNPNGKVTVCTTDHQQSTDIRYRFVFDTFEEARRWAHRLIASIASLDGDKCIRLTASRPWPDGPGGIEHLGTYEHKPRRLTGEHK